MKIYNKIYLISKFIKYLEKKDPNLSSDLANTNYKKVTAHVLKSDLIILIFVNLNLNILNILNIFLKKSIFIFSICFSIFIKSLKKLLFQ